MANSKKAEERAARTAALREQERLKARRRMIIRVGAVVLGMLVIVGVLVGVGQFSGGDDEGDFKGPAAGESDYGLTVGDPDAPHQVIIYEDFLCPFCGELEHASSDKLQQLADDGKVFLEYRPFVLLDQIGPYSADATNAFAVVKEEAGDDVALAFHNLLFANQPAESAESFPGADELVDLAVEAGAEEDAVRPGIEDGAQQEWAEAATKEAHESGVEGTPTIVLDGDNFQQGATVDELVDNLVAEIE